MSELLIINCILYILYAVWSFRKGARCLGFIVSIWAFSSFCSIIYAWLFELVFKQSLDITVAPLAYLFVGFFLCTVSLSSLKNDNNIIAPKDGFLYLISILVILLAIAPFIANIHYALTNMGGNQEVFADNYADKDNRVLPDSLAKLNTYLSWFRAVTPVLLFYFLSRGGHWLLVVGLLMATFEPSLNNLNNGSRFVIVVDTLYLVALYLIVGKSLPEKSRRLIKQAAVVIGSLAGAIFLAITIFRFSETTDVNNEDPLLLALTRYAGESFVDFSDQMWTRCNPVGGENAFTVFTYMFGMGTEPFRDPDSLTALANIDAYIFYTFIGDYFMDFGPYGAALIVLIQSLLLWIFVRNYRKRNTVYNLIWISWIVRILVPGFTYYAYLNNAYEVISTPIINILIFIFCHSYINDINDGKPEDAVTEA